jgi:hypothetical protein
MDRRHLAEWSLELTDSEFAMALAAMGAQIHVPSSIRGLTVPEQPEAMAMALAAELEENDGLLKWFCPQPFPFLDLDRQYLSARTLAEAWKKLLGIVSWPRIAVRHDWSWSDESRVEFAEILAHPEVKASSVFLDVQSEPDEPSEWRWPFTIATLPGDPLSSHLAEFQANFPDPWPFSFAAASRGVSHPEVLVICEGAANALARLLQSGLQLRCCVVIVAGLGSDSLASAVPLLRALVARVDAGGIAILPPGASVQEFAGRLKSLAYEVTHNHWLDVGFWLAFGRESVLFLNSDLLQISRLRTLVDDLANRLNKIPSDALLFISTRSSSMLGLGAGVANFRRPLRTDVTELGPRRVANALETMRDGYRYIRESDEASALSELSRQVLLQEAVAALDAQPERFIQQRSLRKSGAEFISERGGYVVAEPVMVRVRVGPRDNAQWDSAPTAFPDDRLPKSRRAHRLQVMFHEPRQLDAPMLADIELQGFDASTERISSSRPERLVLSRHASACCTMAAYCKRRFCRQT